MFKNNIKKITVGMLMLAFLLSTNTVLAVGSKNHEFSLPTHAVQVAPNVFNLGKVYDKKSDVLLEGYAIVHKKVDVKNNTAKVAKSPSCYVFLANGAKWKGAEDWTVFPGGGLDANFVLENTAANIEKWEVAAGANIFGTGSLGIGVPGDLSVPDDKNEVSFESMSDNDTIAATIIWGIFSGPMVNRKLAAWDQVFNTNYNWSSDALVEPTKMDFSNISTHEIGHAAGMGDIYNSSCMDVTMYGYAKEGEVKKRDLAPADIAGINALY